MLKRIEVGECALSPLPEFAERWLPEGPFSDGGAYYHLAARKTRPPRPVRQPWPIVGGGSRSRPAIREDGRVVHSCWFHKRIILSVPRCCAPTGREQSPSRPCLGQSIRAYHRSYNAGHG